MNYYLGIDLGTTGTKSILFDDSGNVVGKGYKSYGLITPREKFFEQSVEEWYDAVVSTVKDATVGFSGKIKAMSFSAQGGSFLFASVDKDGQPIPLTNAITWMDKRAA
ncbi:MAG: gluconate kinase, partial [Clostridia bacterium]|nr:gluconate kinase [Clostridia bacterium]